MTKSTLQTFCDHFVELRSGSKNFHHLGCKVSVLTILPLEIFGFNSPRQSHENAWKPVIWGGSKYVAIVGAPLCTKTSPKRWISTNHLEYDLEAQATDSMEMCEPVHPATRPFKKWVWLLIKVSFVWPQVITDQYFIKPIFWGSHLNKINTM